MSGDVEVVVFPRIAGVQWSDTVESTLWGMVTGEAVILDIVLPAPVDGVAVAVGCTPAVAFCKPRGSKSCVLQRRRGMRRSRTPWTECRHT